jgi:hypothetical protein
LRQVPSRSEERVLDSRPEIVCHVRVCFPIHEPDTTRTSQTLGSRKAKRQRRSWGVDCGADTQIPRGID